MAELTSTGFVIKTLTEIKADLESRQRANISTTLDVSPSSPHGQHNAVVARALRLVEESMLALYQAIDPDSASGDALDRVCAITGTIREAATATRSTVVVNVDPGTYAIGALVAAVDGRPGDTFANVEAVTNSGGAAANVSALFDAQATGPIACPSNTLVISGALSGWNSVVSNTEGDLGSNVETDGALRVRRAQEVANPGSTSTSGVAADILRECPTVDTVTVIENDTDATVDGIPPHSLEAIVFGPLAPSAAEDLAVATQILESKAGGIYTHGTTSVDVTDAEGQVHAIRFTRPAIEDLVIVIACSVDLSTYAGDTALKTAIATAAAIAYVPGLDGAGSQIAAWAHTVPGVLRVTGVTINGGSAFGVEAIDSRSVARIQSANITVTSTGATP